MKIEHRCSVDNDKYNDRSVNTENEYVIYMNHWEYEHLGFYLQESVSFDTQSDGTCHNHATPAWGPLGERAFTVRNRALELMAELHKAETRT